MRMPSIAGAVWRMMKTSDLQKVERNVDEGIAVAIFQL